MSIPCEEIHPEIETLLAAMTERELDAAGRRRLAELLRDHPDARQFYFDYCQLHALLTDAHGVLQALEPKPPGRGRLLRAAAAGLLAAAGLVLWWRSTGTFAARATPAGGSAWVVRDDRREPLADARPVREGDRLVTGADSRAEVRTRDGSRLVLLDRTDLQLRDRRVDLREGTLRCEVAPRDRSFVFSTPHAEATVLGTAFELTSGGGETRVRTTEGRVRLSSEGRGVDVNAGELGLAGDGGVVRWEPVCDLAFAGLKRLPPSMESVFCRSELHLTPERKVEPAPDRVHFVESGLVLGPAPGAVPTRGLVVARWKEDVGDELVLEADVAAGPRWSLGFAVSGDSFEGYRVVFAAIDGYPNGVAVDTIWPHKLIVLAVDPRGITYDRDQTLRVERRGTRLRAWVDRELRIDTRIDHPLKESRARTFALSNFGSPPVVRGLRAWKAARP